VEAEHTGAKAAETHAGQVNDAHQAAYAHDRTADGDTTPACEADDATEASAQLGEMNLKSGGSRALARHLGASALARIAEVGRMTCAHRRGR
jgi:hypothetical protein